MTWWRGHLTRRESRVHLVESGLIFPRPLRHLRGAAQAGEHGEDIVAYSDPVLALRSKRATAFCHKYLNRSFLILREN
jgi:hypothetical protein